MVLGFSLIGFQAQLLITCKLLTDLCHTTNLCKAPLKKYTKQQSEKNL